MSASVNTHENFEGQKKNVVKVITPRVHTLGKQGKQKKNESSKKSSHKKKKFLKTPFKYEWYVSRSNKITPCMYVWVMYMFVYFQ